MSARARVSASPAGRHQWSQRIVDEVACRRRENGVQELVWFNDLGVSMLDASDSAAGVQWLEAMEDLRRRGLIVIDSAGYVMLTAQGEAAARGLR